MTPPAATAGELLGSPLPRRAPDRFTTEPVVGWRHWIVDDDGPALLSAVWRKVAWPAGARLEADCGLRGASVAFTVDHDSPEMLCRCGIHAWKTAEQALQDLAVTTIRTPGQTMRARAIGRVSLWGRVHEYERGWKAQYAYPHEIIVPGQARARALRARYGVDTAALDVDEEIMRAALLDEATLDRGEYGQMREPRLSFTEALLAEARERGRLN